MNNDDPEAEAVTEVAKTVGKALDVGQGLGKFVARFIGGPLEQASGIVEDKLKYARWERQLRLMERAEEFLDQQGLQGPTRPIPMKIAIPLLQLASLEDDDELQDRWAKLLVNAADVDSGVEVTRSVVSILEDFGPLEARVLQAIYDAPDDVGPNETVSTHLLPEGYGHPGEWTLPPEPVQIAIMNLSRLGCIHSAAMWSGSLIPRLVNITLLGRKVVEACTLREKGES